MIKFAKKIGVGLIAATALSTFMLVGATDAPKSYDVMVNNDYVAFADAPVKVINDRTMVPFRAVLEHLKAEVTYDEQSSIIGATLGDTKISFKEGDKEIKVVKGEKTEMLPMDVAPFVDGKTQRTYVSARFMAEALGYYVDFDGINSTVLIMDINAIKDNVSKNFSVMDKLMKNNVDMTKDYKTAADLKMVMSTTMGEEKSDITSDILMTGYQNASFANMTQIMKVMGKISGLNVKPEDSIMPEQNIRQEIIMDMISGKVYTKSDAFKNNEITLSNGKVLNENAYLLVDMGKTLDTMGMDYSKLMAMSTKGTSVEDIVDLLFQMGKGSFTIDSYNDINKVIAIAKDLFGDTKFQKVVSGDSITYSLNVTTMDIISAVSKSYPDFKTMLNDMLSLEAEGISIDDLKCDIKLRGTIADNVLKSSYISANVALGNKMAVKMIVDAKTPMNSTIDMNMNVDGFMTMDLTGTVTMEVATNPQIIQAPPAGSTIIPMEEMQGVAE